MIKQEVLTQASKLWHFAFIGWCLHQKIYELRLGDRSDIWTVVWPTVGPQSIDQLFHSITVEFVSTLDGDFFKVDATAFILGTDGRSRRKHFGTTNIKADNLIDHLYFFYGWADAVKAADLEPS